MKYNSKKEMMLHFLNGAKKYFVYAFILTTISSLLDMIRPKIIEYTVDGILQENSFLFDAKNLWIPAIAVIVCTLLAALFNYGYQMSTIKGSETFVKRMRDSIFEHIQHVPVQWYNTYKTGDIIQRCTTDIEEVKMFLSEMLVNLVKMLITIVLALAFMLQIHFGLGMVAFASVPIMVLYSFWFHQKIQDGFLLCDENEGILSTICQENLTGVRIVRAFGKEKREQEKFLTQNIKVTGHWVDLAKYMCFFWALSDFLTGFVYFVILTWGSVLCVKNSFTVGALLAMISYLTMLIRPVRSLGRILSELSKTGVSITRLYEIMSTSIEEETGKALTPNMYDSITFDHVSFAYPGQETLLQDISFTIPKGSTLGILGSTGSGKSTIASLLTRLYTCNQGSIQIGETNILDIEQHYLRSSIGYLLQEPYLFSRTIAQNISITRDMEQEEIESYAKLASLHEEVLRFNKGYETFVGERGVTLSGGQKQRVSIARALSLQTPILIFDDSLSAVDTQTDAYIRENIKRMKDKTTILISHRISTLMHADHIIVLEQGRIKEQGTHEELISIPGLYRTIYQIQQGKEEDHE